MNEHPEARDLEAIRRLMETAQAGVPGAWPYFVIWGTVTTLALLVTYVALRGAPISIGWTWGVALAAGWLASLGVGRRQTERATVGNLLHRVVAGIWIGTAVAVTLLVTLGMLAHAVAASALPGLVSILLGSAWFASSFAYRDVRLRVMAVGWWVGGGAMLAWRGPWTLLLMAGLVVAFDLIPGLWLYRRSANQPV